MMGGCETLERLYTRDDHDHDAARLLWSDVGDHGIIDEWESPKESAMPSFIAVAPSLMGQSIESEFAKLAMTWRAETWFMSSVTDIVTHPSYLQIISLGRPVVRLILREMSMRRGHWFAALEAITAEDPVDPSHVGNMKKMTEDWLKFGKQQGWA